MTLDEWIAETEAERPERALWPSETDARRFRDVVSAAPATSTTPATADARTMVADLGLRPHPMPPGIMSPEGAELEFGPHSV